MFTNYASVHACYKYIKLGGGTVGGIRSLRGCWVNSGGCRAASLLVFLCTCGSFVLERFSAVWRFGAGGFLVVALAVVPVNRHNRA